MRDTAPNSVDQAILTFGKTWSGYGGGSDEDIYIEFGLGAKSYFERLRGLLDGPGAAEFDETTRETMRAVCAYRLR
jgi:Protein of unknown function (DUF3263)